MKKENKVKGGIGEAKVYHYLEKSGYKILETNFENIYGEIDIIALKDRKIVFIEVKARSSYAFGRPCEAVTPYKQNKIRQAAEAYLIKKKLYERDMSFDVIEVLDDEINHLKSCF